MLSAIQHMHDDCNIVHRDLKPENILLETERDINDIKLIDFGTAKRFFKDEHGNTIPFSKKEGTTAYMAPEVIKDDYNEKCDIWSIGVIAYILLTGRQPFFLPDLKEYEIKKNIREYKQDTDKCFKHRDDRSNMFYF